MMIKNLISFFVTKLVDNPEVINISEVESENKKIISIKVASNDLAKIIGKEGRTFKALRSLVRVIDNDAHKDILVDSIPQ